MDRLYELLNAETLSTLCDPLRLPLRTSALKKNKLFVNR